MMSDLVFKRIGLQVIVTPHVATCLSICRTILKKEKAAATPKGKAAAKAKADSGAPSKRSRGNKPDVKADDDSKTKPPKKAKVATK